MSDEAFKREAEKVDRIAKDLRRQAYAARRTRRHSGAGSTLEAELSQLEGLISGVKAMIRALDNKYPKAAGPIPSAKADSVTDAEVQYRQAMQGARRAIDEAQTMYDECRQGTGFAGPSPRSDRSASRSPPPSGGRPPRPAGTATSAAALPAAEGVLAEDLDPKVLRQHLIQENRKMSTLNDGEMLVHLTDDDIRGMTDDQLRELAAEARAVRGVAEHIDRLTQEQQEMLNTVEGNATDAAEATERGRKELSQAAKYKMSAMVLSAALIGGLVGGPVGAVAGAKSAVGIAACAAAGSATSVLATKQVTSMVQERLRQDQYDLLHGVDAPRAIAPPPPQSQRDRAVD